MRPGSWRAFSATLVGSLLLQAAWILVVPPFRGLDEHDHAFKAAAVARGDWRWDHKASSLGWGEVLVVPRDLVVAAGPECSNLRYTTTDNCEPGQDQGHGLVLVSSSAARYNPLFYAVVGLPSLMFDGVSSLYAMRAAAALLCSLLVAGAAVALRQWSTTSWPVVALLLTTTPIFIYSTSVVAPNGVELASALLLWIALMGHVRDREHVFPPHVMLTFATLGAVPLATVRALGPLWLALVVITACVLRWDLVRLLLGTRGGRVATGIVGVATVAGVGWTGIAGTNSPGSDAGNFGLPTLAELAGNAVLWVFQSIAAFPARNELAPLPLYAIALVAWWLLGALAFRVADRRLRIVSFGVLVVALMVPVAITLATFDALGSAWQGRYGYPFAMGIVLLCGLALDRVNSRPSVLPLLLAGAVTVTTQLIGQLKVLSAELASSPQAGTPAWAAPAPWLVVLLSLTGGALLSLAHSRQAEQDHHS